MTPEEKAVIEAAMDGQGVGEWPTTAQQTRLRQAVHALIFACPECNAGGHMCPGDGNPIGHTQTDCGEHEEPDHSPGSADVLGVYCDDPKHCPPVICGNCAPLDAGVPADVLVEEAMAGIEQRLAQPEPEWVPATLLLCLAGDHIRMGADETDVTRSSAGIWHADTSNAWHPKAWRHAELRMDVTINPGFKLYPPNLECEILCTPERKATLLLQRAFPGSTIVSSDVD